MSSIYKDIGLGLSIGMGIGVLLMGGIFWIKEADSPPDIGLATTQETSSLPTVFSTATPFSDAFPVPEVLPPTQTPEFIPLQPQPSLTPTITPIPEDLISKSPLTKQEQAQLHAASLQYVSIDYYKVKAIGEAINGTGYGHPSNICGPLAIAILQDATIVSNKIIPYNFWLLNPDIDADRLTFKVAFPESRFESWRDKSALNKIDWASFPLRAGDFLYLYSGSRGNFEHMLAVTRVDESGRAYTVTNHKTDENGFIITEELLYDPNNPGLGLFYQWTEREKALLGSTGFEGFQLWRLKP